MVDSALANKLMGGFDNQWNSMRDSATRFDSQKGDMMKAIDQLKKVKEEQHKKQEETRQKLEQSEKDKIELEKELRQVEFELKKQANQKEKNEKDKEYTAQKQKVQIERKRERYESKIKNKDQILSNLLKEIEKQKEILRQENEKNQELQQTVDKNEEKNSALQLEIKNTEQGINKVNEVPYSEEEKQKIGDECFMIEKEIQSLEREINHLNEQNRNYQNTINTDSVEIKKLEQQIFLQKQAEQEVIKLLEDIKKEKEQMNALRESNSKIEEQTVEVKESIKIKKKQVDELIDSNELIFSLNNFEREARVVFADLQDLDIRIFEVDQRLDVVEAMLQSKKSLLAKYRRIPLWGESLDKFKQECEAFRKKWNNLEKQQDKLQDIVEENVTTKVSDKKLEDIDLDNDIAIAMKTIEQCKNQANQLLQVDSKQILQNIADFQAKILSEETKLKDNILTDLRDSIDEYENLITKASSTLKNSLKDGQKVERLITQKLESAKGIQKDVLNKQLIKIQVLLEQINHTNFYQADKEKIAQVQSSIRQLSPKSDLEELLVLISDKELLEKSCTRKKIETSEIEEQVNKIRREFDQTENAFTGKKIEEIKNQIKNINTFTLTEDLNKMMNQISKWQAKINDYRKSKKNDALEQFDQTLYKSASTIDKAIKEADKIKKAVEGLKNTIKDETVGNQVEDNSMVKIEYESEKLNHRYQELVRTVDQEKKAYKHNQQQWQEMEDFLNFGMKKQSSTQQ